MSFSVTPKIGLNRADNCFAKTRAARGEKNDSLRLSLEYWKAFYRAVLRKVLAISQRISHCFWNTLLGFHITKAFSTHPHDITWNTCQTIFVAWRNKTLGRTGSPENSGYCEPELSPGITYWAPCSHDTTRYNPFSTLKIGLQSRGREKMKSKSRSLPEFIICLHQNMLLFHKFTK